MKIEKLKYNNFIRICREHGIYPDDQESRKKLMVILKASKQHVSQLLSGKSSIGPGTIKKLCDTWKIDEFEFIKRDELKQEDFMCGWDEESRNACQRLKEILDSKDKFAVPAILSNLNAFNDSIQKNKNIEKMGDDIIKLKKSIRDLLLDSERRQRGAKGKT